MPFPDIAPQSWFFYTLKWEAEKDCLLLRRLLAKEEECKPTLPHRSPHTLLSAMGSLNQEFGINLRLVDVEERVEFLKSRYNTFKKITRFPETYWDLQKNTVTADDGVWTRIFKENIFAQTYYHKGEPEYYKMCCLFGAEAVKKEHSHTVIVTHDSSRDKLNVSYDDLDSLSSEEEVNSPFPKIGSSVARKLFLPDASLSVLPPNSGHFYVSWPAKESKFAFPAINAFPPKPKENKEKPSGVGGSSCASWSPFK